MRRRHASPTAPQYPAPILAALTLGLAACATAGPVESTEPSSPSASEAQSTAGAAKPQAEAESKDIKGLFVPAAPVPLALWPEAYRGELVLLEVAAQGTTVQAGEVLARLDARAIDRELAEAEFSLRSAEAAHAGLLERHALAQESAAASMARSREALRRSERNLTDWKQTELAFARRGDQLASAWETARIADQEDELEQLELMYGADELTDATEDLVLMRTRRDLDLSRQRTELSAAQRKFQDEVKRAEDLAKREEALAKQQLELAHLERNLELGARDRELAGEKSSRGVAKQREKLEQLRRDRELFTLRAPTSGVFLHGATDAYLPGSVPRHLKRGDKLSVRSIAAHVAPTSNDAPGGAANAVVIQLAADKAAALQDGARAMVSPAGRTGAKAVPGVLSITPYPEPGKGGSVYRARIELERPLPGVRAGMPATVTLDGAQ